MPTPVDLSSFEIDGLHGSTKVSAAIKNNTLILVGENGSGKTTFLRIMFHFLSGRWESLAQFEFTAIHAVVNGSNYSITRKELKPLIIRHDDRTISSLPPQYRRRYREAMELGRYEEAESIINPMFRYASRHNSKQQELEFERAQKSLNKLNSLKDRLSRDLGAQILYLPTYRRIERELSSIVKGLDPEDARRYSGGMLKRQPDDGNDYVELVEFGMADVQKSIDGVLEGIRDFQLQGATRLTLSYLGDVVSQEYLRTDSTVIAEASEESIFDIIDRLDNTILTESHKTHLKEIVVSRKMASVPSEHELIIYHYLASLIKFQKDLRSKEKNINSFCKLCSEYIENKNFIYESTKISFKIESKNERPVNLSELSSGEKQIVSLFAHLYLAGREKFFVLIDEPELSLSVPWQRRILTDIRSGSYCAGLIAVTHSPFIYDNELRPFARALGEFVSGSDWGHIS